MLHNKLRDIQPNAPLGHLPVDPVHDLLLVPAHGQAVLEPDLLVPGRCKANTVIVGDKHFLALLNVLHRHYGHDAAKPGVLKLSEDRILLLKAVASLVSKGCSVLRTQLVVRVNIKVYRLVKGQSKKSSLNIELK